MDVEGCRNLGTMQVILIDDSDIDNKVNTKLLKLARLTSDIQALSLIHI